MTEDLVRWSGLAIAVIGVYFVAPSAPRSLMRSVRGYTVTAEGLLWRRVLALLGRPTTVVPVTATVSARGNLNLVGTARPQTGPPSWAGTEERLSWVVAHVQVVEALVHEKHAPPWSASSA